MERIEDKESWASKIAELLNDEKIIGLMMGRLEFGPRALGDRSIIADSRSEKMQSKLNLKIKYRESFRPFAPSCLEEDVEKYFNIKQGKKSPYMLFTQTNLIRGLTKREYQLLRLMCFFSKNLYNVTLYNIRQHYFTEKKHLRYESNYHITKDNENYKLL